jgi:hypothetical protein
VLHIVGKGNKERLVPRCHSRFSTKGTRRLRIKMGAPGNKTRPVLG